MRFMTNLLAKETWLAIACLRDFLGPKNQVSDCLVRMGKQFADSIPPPGRIGAPWPLKVRGVFLRPAGKELPVEQTGIA